MRYELGELLTTSKKGLNFAQKIFTLNLSWRFHLIIPVWRRVRIPPP
jgi:hypothetical protein